MESGFAEQMLGLGLLLGLFTIGAGLLIGQWQAQREGKTHKRDETPVRKKRKGTKHSRDLAANAA
jgi:hypothetical protein